MQRRDFIRLLMLSSPLLLGGCSHIQKFELYQKVFKANKDKDTPESINDDIAETQDTQDLSKLSQKELSDLLLKDARAKSENFNLDFPDDIFFRDEKLQMLKTLVVKFRGVQKHIGFGNFNLIGMDEFFALTHTAPRVEPITSAEKQFLEELFYFDATKYGFMGDKVLNNFTDTIKKNQVVKIPYTGHYLKKEGSLEIYDRLKTDIGPSLTLTSGVRSSAKQFHLFMEKGLQTNGNMSKASRSLAPPGYSFHSRGDFDVGKIGYGLKNFTEDFADTDEYKRLLDLGYINIRYTQSNLLGVRFEPWHIKVEA